MDMTLGEGTPQADNEKALRAAESSSAMGPESTPNKSGRAELQVTRGRGGNVCGRHSGMGAVCG